MSFGDYSEETDEAGHWFTIPYNGMPAVKLLFPSETEATVNTKPVAVFWQGAAKPEAVDVFIRAVVKEFGYQILTDLVADNGEQIGPSVIGVGSPAFPKERVYLGLELKSGDRVELWADGEKPSHGLTPEVGLSVASGVLLSDPILAACAALVQSTIRWREIDGEQVGDLMRIVTAKVNRHYKLQPLALGG